MASYWSKVVIFPMQYAFGAPVEGDSITFSLVYLSSENYCL